MQFLKRFSCIYKFDLWFEKASSIINLIARFYLARIFFLSGLTKLDNWNATLFLFKHEYSVPLLSSELAALITTFVELILVPLFLLGFMTRYIALCLLAMTMVINFSYIENVEHYYWMIIFSMIMVYGGGYLSLDHWLKARFLGTKG